jgi:NAD+ synthase
MAFHKKILEIDSEREVKRIVRFIQRQARAGRKSGVVIGLSGGIDSAVTLELCARSMGKSKVLGLILPDRESDPRSKEFAQRHARKLGVRTEVVDITKTLDAFGTYRIRDRAIRTVFPEYGNRHKMKISLPGDLLARDDFNIYTLTIENTQGRIKSARPDRRTLASIVAATNFKQRTRMLYLYHYAEKMGLLVCGTTNRTEFVLGFFVKYGDGGVDIEPLAHLYKTQIFQLAKFLGVSEEIRQRIPSPDTFSLEISDQEFFFRVPYGKLDFLLYAWESETPIHRVCQTLGLEANQVKRAFRDFDRKHKISQHLRRLPPSVAPRADGDRRNVDNRTRTPGIR